MLYTRHSSGRCCFGSHRCADRIENDALLGARLLFVPAGAAEGRIEAVVIQRLPERLSLHDVRVQRRPVHEGVDAHLEPFAIDVHQEIQPETRRRFVAERDHVAELPRGVDVKKREWRPGREERLERQVQHHRAVLADRVEHDGPLALGDDLAHDVDALRFEPLKMCELGVCGHRHQRGIIVWLASNAHASACESHDAP